MGRWQALGREITRPIDDDHDDGDLRLMAFRELVPFGLAELMMTQLAFKSYPEALMYTRRHMTDRRHASLAEVVRQNGRTPMDISALIAAAGQLCDEPHERRPEDAARPTIWRRPYLRAHGSRRGPGAQRQKEA